MTYRYPGGLVRRTAANTSITGASGVWDLGSQAQAVKTNTWPISGLANPVSGSLRFRASASAYLNRTPASAGNRKTFTYSGWIKRGGSFGVDQTIFGCNNGNSNANAFEIFFTTSNTIGIIEWDFYYLDTTQVFRDPAAWYHIVLAVDTTNATANNRIRLYINGVEVTAFGTRTNPTQNADLALNNTIGHQIGAINYVSSGGLTRYFDGYMTEVNFIDGQQLTPSSFGQTSPITGVWEPIKYTGTYGTNGFYLSLSDTSSIGKDFSGNGKNWTPNNISTASGSTFDLMRDVPTQWAPQGVTDVGGVVRGNYCTWNPAFERGNESYSDGNLNGTTGTSGGVIGTIGVTTGKWYWETINPTTTSAARVAGLINFSTFDRNMYTNSIYVQRGGGYSINDGSTVSYGSAAAIGDIIGVALDVDARTVIFYLNGVAQGSAISLASVYSVGQTVVPAITQSGAASRSFVVNFGQRPFAYAPPAGYKSLCTTNLPTPTIGATAATAAGKYFNTVIWTGTGGTRSITGVGFQPDFVWAKARSQAYSNILFDSNRGVGKNLLTDTTGAEATNEANGYISSFDADGFSSNFSAAANYYFNQSGTTYVAWNWNAGGSTVTNTAGSISAQVRANPTAGFSIVTFTAPSGSTAYTVGHGLGTTPAMIIVKDRGAAGNDWYVWHKGYSNTAQGNQRLNTTAAVGNSSSVWNNTAPTDTVFSSLSGTAVSSSTTAVAYCFAEIAGYSAFGRYTGNGSSNGPFVFTGFRPRFVMVKRTTSTGAWCVYDTSRNTYNVADLEINPNSSAAENSGNALDVLSNGFKWRDSFGAHNAVGVDYIYMAFAEHPFKNALAR